MDKTETIQLRHHDICNYESRAFPLDDFQSLPAVLRRDHPVSFETQGGFQQFSDIGVIFHNEQIAFLCIHMIILHLSRSREILISSNFSVGWLVWHLLVLHRFQNAGMLCRLKSKGSDWIIDGDLPYQFSVDSALQ